jgi:hypothetical protein
MPEGLPYFSLESLDWSIYIFSENERELLAYLCECEEGPSSEELWHQPSEWQLRQVALEISRLLHNYVAAATSLLEHLDRIHSKLFAKREFPEFRPEKKRRITEEPLVRFIRELRNIALHQGDSSVSFHASTEPLGGSVKHEVSISRSYLEGVRRWQGPAKVYLEGAPQSIALRALVEDYGRHVRQFCEWYRERVFDIWGAEYLRYREAMKEYLRARLEGHADNWLTDPTPPCHQIGFLRRVIDDAELSELEHIADGSPERADRAIALLRSHLSISEPLAEKLRKAFSVPGFRL